MWVDPTDDSPLTMTTTNRVSCHLCVPACCCAKLILRLFDITWGEKNSEHHGSESDRGQCCCCPLLSVFQFAAAKWFYARFEAVHSFTVSLYCATIDWSVLHEPRAKKSEGKKNLGAVMGRNQNLSFSM